MNPTRAFDPAKMKASAADYSSSDSEEEDDDYMMPSTNPNANEFADYNPRKRRRTGRDAKESAALGVFGSESEDEGPARQWKRRTLRNKGMSFVSSADNAPKNPDEDDDMPDENGDEEEEDEEDFRPTMCQASSDEDDEENYNKEERPAVGLGFSASVSNPLGMGFKPSSAYEPVLKARDDTPTRPPVARPSAFSSSKGGKSKSKFNPKSFGSRMMAKMGFVEGSGLGKEGQGRNMIIEANLRPQGIGLGAVKEKTEQERQEEKRQARLRGEVVIDSDEEEKKKRAERKKKSFVGGLRSGSGSAASTPKRQKPKYMTLDEVKKAAPGLHIPDSFTPILDLTGPGRKMLTSSSGLMTPTGGTMEDQGDVQSKKLVRRAQNDFMAILEEWQGLQERKAFAELQLQQENQELEELEKAVQSYQATASIFDELSQHFDGLVLGGADHKKQQWDRTISLLQRADVSTSHLTIQAVREEMASTAVAAIHPALGAMLENWNPLESPRAQHASDLESIKGLLGLKTASGPPQARSSATPFETMIYKLWLPHVSRAVREWNVLDAEPMIALYDAWCKVLPGFVKTHLLEQDIIRRLEEAIAKWEPKRKKHHSLPHLWLFPWLQYLPYHHVDPKSSTGLVSDVRRKFRQLIDMWGFDRGVIPGLKEWKIVLRDQWKPLVMNHILPSMARYLRKNFRVEPSDQEPYLQLLTGVFEWLEFVSPTMVGEVIVAEVFPMWHDTLYQWLVMEEVNYEEVAQWIEWWRDEAFPAEIRNTASVASEFEKSIHTIERALEIFELGEDPKTTLAPPGKGPAFAPQKTSTNGHHHHASNHHREHKQPTAIPTTKDEEKSFRHVIEDWCQENDLQFIPERKKHHSEGPLYRITARGDGKGGQLAYFQGPKLCLLTKNGVEGFTGASEGDLDRLMTYVM